jgi:hypothetical protein
MKKLLLSVLVVLLFIMSCTIPSVHPLVTEDIEIQFDEIIGTYEVDDEYWKFKRNEDKTRSGYYLEVGETKQELKVQYQVYFTELNGRVFADFFPIYLAEDVIGSFDYIPMHTFARIDMDEGNPVLRYSDMDEMKKLFTEGKVRLKHERMTNGDILITASSAQLQKFISQHGGNDVFFGLDQELKRLTAKVDAGE